MAVNTDRRKPTEAELNILGVIWEMESATVRQVFDNLRKQQEIGYTTVLKLMQIMTDKGILTRETDVRPQIYQPAIPRQQTQKLLLKRLLDLAFDGSPGPMVLQALSMKKSSPKELQEIRDLLDTLED
jgi:BlaI family transcriptional regulator, penicillinase repressor